MKVFSKQFLIRLLLYVSLGLVVFGVRCKMIDAYGTDVPFYDQWDAEGRWILKPLLEGHYDWKQLFSPHNEHRVFWSRLMTLAAFEINGQWDGRLEALMSVGVLVIGVLVLFHCLGGFFEGWRKYVLWGGLAVLFTFPYSLNNTIYGFQSQFYFLMLFSLLHLWGSLHGRIWSTSWVLGQLAGVAAIFSMSSGVLSSIAVAGSLVYLMILKRKWDREALMKLGAVALVGAIGVMAFHSYELHEYLRSHSLKEFWEAIVYLLAWPGKSVWVALLFVLPVVLLLIPPRKEEEATGNWLFLLGYGLWIGGQMAAIAYARGGVNHGASERYADLFGLYCLAGFAALNYLSLRARAWPKLAFLPA